jgi:hypothetical protein
MCRSGALDLGSLRVRSYRVDTQVAVAVTSAVISLLSALTAGLMTSWSAIRTKRFEKAQSKAEIAEQILSRYREPLLNAAHDLQGRLYNIVKRGYLANYLRCGDPDLERYAIDYTLYALAQYICWAEIVRRDMRFLDLGTEASNRDWVHLLEATQNVISYEEGSRPLRLFRGEQRAIGELMMTSGGEGSARFEPIGYLAFSEKLEHDSTFERWFRRLRSDLVTIATTDLHGHDRLVTLQNRLIDLIAFLDPEGARLPRQHRRKLEGPQQPLPNPE